MAIKKGAFDLYTKERQLPKKNQDRVFKLGCSFIRGIKSQRVDHL